MSTPNFEAMSNDELRQQMEDLGLPKVPITASTRSILIKRLQNHVNGTPSKSSTKSRRETMHVVKYSSDDDSDRDAAKEKLKKKMENHKNARRQTIGGAALSQTAPDVVATQPSAVPSAVVEKASRKSMRATPTKSVRESLIPPPSKVKVAVPVTIEDSDEEEVILPRVPPAVDRRSKSKTPSTLGKSDLVTTSYKHVVAPVQEEPIEVDDDEAEEEEEHRSEPEERVPVAAASRYTSSKYSPSVRISPLRYPSDGGNITSSYRREEPVATTTSNYVRPSLATSRTHTTSMYTSKYATEGGTRTTRAAVDEPRNEEEDFPYLREFSKRLSTLKAEPLYKRHVPMSSAAAVTRTPTIYNSAPRSSSYRPLVRREPRWYDPISRSLVSLEEHYALKKKILVLLSVLVVIFLVVMFL